MKHLLLCTLLTALSLAFSSCHEEDPPTTECQTHCALQPETGPCNAAFQRYYFDPVEKKCKPFTWGGCAGVVPFETLEACESCGCQ